MNGEISKFKDCETIHWADTILELRELATGYSVLKIEKITWRLSTPPSTVDTFSGKTNAKSIFLLGDSGFSEEDEE